MPMSRAVMLAVPPRSTASNGTRGTGSRRRSVSRTACTVPSPPLIAIDVDTALRQLAQRAAPRTRVLHVAAGYAGMGGEHAVASPPRHAGSRRFADCAARRARVARGAARDRAPVPTGGMAPLPSRLARGGSGVREHAHRQACSSTVWPISESHDRIALPLPASRAAARSSRSRSSAVDNAVHTATASRPKSGRPSARLTVSSDHVRIAPRRDQPEPGVERTPREDREARDEELERAFAQAAADVADENDPVDER